jgi:hypothetical protein
VADGNRGVGRFALTGVDSFANCASCAFEYFCVSVEDARGVGRGEECLEFEGELLGSEAAVQLVELLGLASESFEDVQPVLSLCGDCVAGGPWPGADVRGGCGEEAAAGKDPPLDMGEVGLADGE